MSRWLRPGSRRRPGSVSGAPPTLVVGELGAGVGTVGPLGARVGEPLGALAPLQEAACASSGVGLEGDPALARTCRRVVARRCRGRRRPAGPGRASGPSPDDLLGQVGALPSSKIGSPRLFLASGDEDSRTTTRNSRPTATRATTAVVTIDRAPLTQPSSSHRSVRASMRRRRSPGRAASNALQQGVGVEHLADDVVDDAEVGQRRRGQLAGARPPRAPRPRRGGGWRPRPRAR